MKKIWLIVFIILGILLLLILFFVYKLVNEKAHVDEYNEIGYNYLVCISECTNEITSGGIKQIQQSCADNCAETAIISSDAENVPYSLRSENSGLLGSEEHKTCLENRVNQIEEFQVCLKRILPILKERYKIED